MSMYYMIPYEDLPSTTDDNMWFATWSTTNTTVLWSHNKPSFVPNGTTSFVVGVTCTAPPTPTGSTQLSDVDAAKMPPPPAEAFSATDMYSFKTGFDAWTNGRKSFTLPADARMVERD